LGSDEIIKVSSDRFFRGISEEPFRPGVPLHDAMVVVKRHYRIRDGSEYALEIE
jgi:hypothetical protein